jgi:serine/threonine-protein kinase
VIAQDPEPGERLIQTGTVTITVVKGELEPSPPPAELVTVPDVIGMTQGAANAALRGAGFDVSVSLDQECDPEDPACDYRQGVVWAQSPSGGEQAEDGSTVTIVVNP